MLFNSLVFLCFLIVVVCLYYAFPRARMYILVTGNAVFYAYAGIAYLILFFFVVTITYLFSKNMRGKYKKWFLSISIIVVLSNLLFFKYSMFLLGNIERLFGFQLDLQGTLFEGRSIILPIGISFYTFQLIAYLVDVYKGRVQPSRSLFEFWAFIAFFAHSAAGPILRGSDFLPQLRGIDKIPLRPMRFKLGIAYIMMGLCKKLLLAETIAPDVNNFFSHADMISGGEAWIAAYLFAFQIYFDFSAYSEMAVGIGHLLGLRLDINFRTPYLSANGTEFWRRWHITLSQWIRDFIYIPLGGSRVSEWRTYVNLIAAMTLSGLWHGPAWTFIIWGLFHGLLSAGHKLYRKILGKIGLLRYTSGPFYHIFAIFIFFHLTVIGWVFFRANGIREALMLIKKMILFNPIDAPPVLYGYFITVLLLYILHIVEFIIVKKFKIISLKWQLFVPTPLRAVCYTMFLILILFLLIKEEPSSFIYFQF